MTVLPVTAPRPLKQRLREREPVLGALVRLPGELVVEACGIAGLDYIALDCEHGPGDLLAVRQHIVLAHSLGLEVLVRIPAGDHALALRALDLGATGIIAPHVTSREDAERVVAAATYPPRGNRGFATYTPAGLYGTMGAVQHLQAASDSTLVVMMIEDAEGVEQADAILSVDGVDAVLVGPADLAVSLGHPGAPTHDQVREAIAAVHAAADRAGRTVMRILGTADAARVALDERGSTMVLFNATQLVMDALIAAAATRPYGSRQQT